MVQTRAQARAIARWASQGRWPAREASPNQEVAKRFVRGTLDKYGPIAQELVSQEFISQSISSYMVSNAPARARKHLPYKEDSFVLLINDLGSFMDDSETGPASGSQL